MKKVMFAVVVLLQMVACTPVAQIEKVVRGEKTEVENSKKKDLVPIPSQKPSLNFNFEFKEETYADVLHRTLPKLKEVVSFQGKELKLTKIDSFEGGLLVKENYPGGGLLSVWIKSEKIVNGTAYAIVEMHNKDFSMLTGDVAQEGWVDIPCEKIRGNLLLIEMETKKEIVRFTIE